MEDAWDEGRGGVNEPEVCFDIVVVGGRGGSGRPEEWVVVGEEREDDAEEEGGCCDGEYMVRMRDIKAIEVLLHTAHNEKGRERPVCERHGMRLTAHASVLAFTDNVRSNCSCNVMY